jgi:hypothetical protein
MTLFTVFLFSTRLVSNIGILTDIHYTSKQRYSLVLHDLVWSEFLINICVRPQSNSYSTNFCRFSAETRTIEFRTKFDQNFRSILADFWMISVKFCHLGQKSTNLYEKLGRFLGQIQHCGFRLKFGQHCKFCKNDLLAYTVSFGVKLNFWGLKLFIVVFIDSTQHKWI